MPTLLIVEDDHALRDLLVRATRQAGYDVLAAADAASGLRSLTPDVDAVVLDIGLPDGDGRDLCSAFRATHPGLPVLMLTARSSVGERVAGFAAGADDYLTKPFHIAELLARVQALVRRGQWARTVPEEAIVVDPLRFVLRTPAGEVRLTPTEFRVAACLLAAPRGAVLTRRELAVAGWGAGAHVSDNTLDQFIAKLRRRLAELEAAVVVDTVRGVGYRLT